ncbi:GNAT family N-acetyltransferase [Candidatus Hodarchaeum mangrovi]
MTSAIDLVHKEVVIRKSIMEDIDRFIEIEKKCFSPKFRYEYSILFSLLYMYPKFITYSACLNEKVIGYISGELDEIDQSIFKIVTIAVEPEFQRKNIATQLLQTLIETIKKTYKISRVELHVYSKNQPAIDFYSSHGFKIQKEIKNYYFRRAHALLMGKELK